MLGAAIWVGAVNPVCQVIGQLDRAVEYVVLNGTIDLMSGAARAAKGVAATASAADVPRKPPALSDWLASWL